VKPIKDHIVRIPPAWIIPGLLLAACAGSEPRGASEVDTLADRYLAAWTETFPDLATAFGISDAPHDRLPDLSPEARATWQALEDSLLVALEAVDVRGLAEGDAALVTRGFLHATLRNSIDWRACRMELWNVSPTWTGWLSTTASLAELQAVGTEAQRSDAAARFSAVPRYVEQEITNLREGMREGYTAPRHNVEAVIRQAEALLAGAPEATPWVVMAADSVPGFRAQMIAIDSSAIRPAIARYRDFLRDEYLPVARTAIGVSANPQGAGCYRAAVRYHATVDASPQEVHQTGLDQMALIRAEMAAIAERLFGNADIPAALTALRSDPAYLMGSREAVLALARDAVARSKAAAPQWFGITPRADVVVEPVPTFAEASAPGAFYNSPAEDGSRPGRYSINLYESETKPRAGIEATAFHEAFPGHHLQIAIAMEREGLHPIQRYLFLSGFGEGWGLYTERLADEMGLYSADVDRFGLLSNEALRAARLVVDAGMHALGWTREQSIQYMMDNTAESRASITAEVDRYIAVPGQATAYMLGSLEIARLRAEAQAALGERFDIREFHDRVLEDGAMPLSMLREKIERWMAGGT
jgi:uncharacterized protein (DUF885 family)